MSARARVRCVALLAAGMAVIAAGLARLTAQTPTLTLTGDAVHVRAPEFHFLQGDLLTRLRDGRSARIDVRLDILARRDGTPVAHAEQAFNVSFDLWEERFAIAKAGPPARSVTHLTSAAAEAWCVDNVTVPVAELGTNRSAPLWIRLTLRVHEDPAPREADGDPPFSIRHLIDALSRRSPAEDPARVLTAGPIRLMP